MSDRLISRRRLLNASAVGGMVAASALADPIRAAAQAVGIKRTDLPDLTIKEVKVYILEGGSWPPS